MKRIPLPSSICKVIADSALQHCRIYAIQRGWKTADKLSSIWDSGKVGINTSVHYLIYQDRGIRPFLMYSLEGQTIPLKDNTGTTHWVTVTRVGEPGIVKIPGDSNKPKSALYKSRAARPGLTYRDQRWKHPGIEETKFIRNSILKSINNGKPLVRNYLKDIISGGTS